MNRGEIKQNNPSVNRLWRCFFFIIDTIINGQYIGRPKNIKSQLAIVKKSSFLSANLCFFKLFKQLTCTNQLKG